MVAELYQDMTDLVSSANHHRERDERLPPGEASSDCREAAREQREFMSGNVESGVMIEDCRTRPGRGTQNAPKSQGHVQKQSSNCRETVRGSTANTITRGMRKKGKWTGAGGWIRGGKRYYAH